MHNDKKINNFGIFPSLKEKIVFDKIPEQIKQKKKKRRKTTQKQTKEKIICLDYERKIINKINFMLRKYNYKSKNFILFLGRAKGKIHRKKLNETNIKNYINYLGIKWEAIRDCDHMKKYKLKHKYCEHCLVNKTECCHHIVSPIKGGKEIDDNYLALCEECHCLYHPELPINFLLSTPYLKNKRNIILRSISC